MVLRFPARLQLARLPTPLQPLERLSALLGGPRVWVKRDDLTGCADSGNKIRKLEFTLAEVQAQGADTVVTLGGVQSNHCRATALLCARLGLRCHLLLRGEPPAGDADGNLLLDELCGARLSFFRPARFQQEREAIIAECVAEHRAAGHHPFVIPIGASDEIGLWGYIAATGELLEDFDRAGIRPRHIVCATGSGGTQGGLTLGTALLRPGLQVWGINVCDDAAWFHAKITADIAAWHRRYRAVSVLPELAINTIEGYVGPGYGRATAEVFATIRQLAQLEGIVLDPVYTGKAFHGLCEEIRRGRFAGSEDIVFVHTGGIFGLFPQRDQLFSG